MIWRRTVWSSARWGPLTENKQEKKLPRSCSAWRTLSYLSLECCFLSLISGEEALEMEGLIRQVGAGCQPAGCQLRPQAEQPGTPVGPGEVWGQEAPRERLETLQRRDSFPLLLGCSSYPKALLQVSPFWAGQEVQEAAPCCLP